MGNKIFKNRLLINYLNYTPANRIEEITKLYLFIVDNGEIAFVKAKNTELACEIIEQKYPTCKYFLQTWISHDCENINLIPILE